MLRSIASALLGLALTTCGVAATDLAQVTGKAGSWALLLDDDDRPIYAWYWLGPEALLVFPGKAAAAMVPGPNQQVVVDRSFLPTRMIAVPLLMSRGFDYGEIPDFGSMAEPVAIPVNQLGFSGVLAGQPREEESYAISFQWTGEEHREFPSAGSVAARLYEADNLTVVDRGDLTFMRGGRERAYLPLIGVDIDVRTWDEVADVRHGDGLAGSPDLAFEAWLAGDADPDMAACLRGIRQAPGYQTWLGDFGGLERRTAHLIGNGTTDVLAYGLEPYFELEAQGRVLARFRDCLTR